MLPCLRINTFGGHNKRTLLRFFYMILFLQVEQFVGLCGKILRDLFRGRPPGLEILSP